MILGSLLLVGLIAVAVGLSCGVEGDPPETESSRVLATGRLS